MTMKRQFIPVVLRRVSDGVERLIPDDVGLDPDCDAEYRWHEGNYSCDCNRELFFERAAGVELDVGDTKCSNGRYRIVAPDWLAEI